MFNSKADKKYTDTINMLIDENRVRGENNKKLIMTLCDELDSLRQELDRKIRIETNMEVTYGVHYIKYPLKSFMSKLLKTLGYKIEYNKPEKDLFKLTKIK